MAAAAAAVSTGPSMGGAATVTQAGAFRAGQVERLPHRGATGALGAAAAAAAAPHSHHPGSGVAGGGGGAAHAQGDPQAGGPAGGGGGCPGAQLLNARWEFETDAASKLLFDANSDYRVVGVLGPQGAGKSSLLTSLLLPEGLPAGAGAGAGDVSFPVQGPGHVAAGYNCTQALELRAVPDLPLTHASGAATTAMGRAIAHVDLLAACGSGSDAKDQDQDNTHGLSTQHHQQKQQQQQSHPDHRHLNFWALPRLFGPASARRG